MKKNQGKIEYWKKEQDKEEIRRRRAIIVIKGTEEREMKEMDKDRDWEH